jgi:iron complex outermembrane receptor protein
MKSAWLAAASSLILGAYSGATQAQSIEEIFVTAEKRTANLQETPIAISAYSQSTIDDYGVRDVRDLTRLVPTLELAPVATGAIYFALRGVGNESPLAGGDNGVATHFDGVYIARPAATLVNLYDVERVEVLRGPQGTLYGRNATGGVINLISNKPEDELAIQGDFTYGNYDMKRLRAMVNVPLTDKIAARAAGVFTRREGFQFNQFLGERQGDDDRSEYVRLSIAYEDDGPFSALLTGVYSHTGGAGPQPVLGNEVIPLAPVAFIPVAPGVQAPILFNPNSVTSNPSAQDPRVTNYDDVAQTDFEVAGITAHLDWEADGFTVKSITGFYNNKINPTTPFDQFAATIPDPADPSLPPFTFFIPPPPGTMLPPTPITDGAPFSFLIGRSTGLGINFVNDSTQVSQEVNVASNTSGPFEWLVGGFFFHEQIDFTLEGDALPHIFFTPLNPAFAGFPEFGLFNTADFKATSLGIFANGSYQINEQIKVRGGLRYNYDKKKADLIEHTVVTGDILVADSPEESWDALTGNIGLDWFVTDENMLYASVARGYKAGAINLVRASDNIVDPETIWSYEIGSKNQFFENRLQVNAALFYADYNNLQVNFFEPTGSVLRNANSAEIFGLELDVIASPTDYITVSGAFAWTDATYADFVTDNPFTGQTGVDLSGNRLNQTPEIAFNLGAKVILPIAPELFELSFHVDHTWKDQLDFQAFNTDLTRSDSFGITNLRLTAIEEQNQRWRLELFVNNVQNTDAVQSIQLPPTLSTATANNPSTAIHYRPPRTYGVTVGVNF